jgi:hypothetical protein
VCSKDRGASGQFLNSFTTECFGHGTRLEGSQVAINTGVDLGEFVGDGQEFVVVARVAITGPGLHFANGQRERGPRPRRRRAATQ